VAGVIAISTLWGGLFLAFRHWRAAYRDRAAQGAARVARAIGPLTEISPPGTTPAAWQRVVVETRAMLLTLTASNLLDRAGVDALGAEIDARVARARARPETALDELAGLWDDLAARAGPVVGRHPRPAPLPPPWPVRRPP